MKKQVKKVAKEKAQPKKAIKKSKPKKAVTEENQQSDSEPETEIKNEIENAPSEAQGGEQLQHTQLSMEDRRRLEFKFGGRILDDDLTGTRAEVIHKVSLKVGETPEYLTVMLNDEDFSG